MAPAASFRSAITISLVPESLGGPFVYTDGLAAGCAEAARLGYDAVEIFPASAATLDRTLLRELLGEHRLRVAAVGTGAGWVVHKLMLTHADPEIRQRAREFIREIINLAGEFGAPAIIGSMQGRWEGTVTRDQALAWLAEALEDLGEAAAAHRVPLLYEPLNRYETYLLNRLGDTARWLRTLRTRNVRILADLFHMNIEEADMVESILKAGTAIGHVHFADTNRLAVGSGHLSVQPLIDALGQIGYRGFLSAEVFPLPDSQKTAERTIRSFKQSVRSV
jgi:sugar phosphate isomerase/epimerase